MRQGARPRVCDIIEIGDHKDRAIRDGSIPDPTRDQSYERRPHVLKMTISVRGPEGQSSRIPETERAGGSPFLVECGARE